MPVRYQVPSDHHDYYLLRLYCILYRRPKEKNDEHEKRYYRRGGGTRVIIGQGRCTTDTQPASAPDVVVGNSSPRIPGTFLLLGPAAAAARPAVLITRLNAFNCVRLFVCVRVRAVYIQHPRVVVRVAPVRRAPAVRVRFPHVPVRADPRDRLTVSPCPCARADATGCAEQPDHRRRRPESPVLVAPPSDGRAP